MRCYNLPRDGEAESAVIDRLREQDRPLTIPELEFFIQLREYRISGEVEPVDHFEVLDAVLRLERRGVLREVIGVGFELNQGESA